MRRLLPALLAASWALPAPAQAPAFKEYEVKAAYLFNFAKFVEWPAQAFPGPQAPLAIGILGEDPFGPALDELVQGKTIRERPVTVRRVPDAAAAAACQVLFIADSERPRLAEVLAALGHSPVLTVGESRRFLRAGGVIALRLEGARVRFDVDLGAAEQAGLKLNSQLLKLAGEVRRGRAGGGP